MDRFDAQRRHGLMRAVLVAAREDVDEVHGSPGAGTKELNLKLE